MDNKNKKSMAYMDAEQKFKDMVFDIFSSRMPSIHKNADGLIVVPIPIRKKADIKQNNDKKQ